MLANTRHASRNVFPGKSLVDFNVGHAPFRLRKTRLRNRDDLADHKRACARPLNVKDALRKAWPSLHVHEQLPYLPRRRVDLSRNRELHEVTVPLGTL